MAFTRRAIAPLVFPIGDQDYTVPPVGIDAGERLIALFAKSQAELKKEKIDQVALFKLAVTPEIWEQMRADGVQVHDAWRVGMATLAHFQVLSRNTSPDAEADAVRAAEAIWDSGIDPEALAAHMAAIQQTTPRSTRQAAANTTQRRASGTGTKRPKTTRAKKTASKSPGRPSPQPATGN